jgi:hypothetical protein
MSGTIKATSHSGQTSESISFSISEPSPKYSLFSHYNISELHTIPYAPNQLVVEPIPSLRAFIFRVPQLYALLFTYEFQVFCTNFKYMKS